MKKSKIYTKTGDEGNTGLVSGNRVFKSDARIDLYGELDELNSRIGLASAQLSTKQADIVSFLHVIQSAIFDLGSNLACEAENRSRFKLPQIPEKLIHDLESNIDTMDSQLDPLKNFILPGGSLATSFLHLARTSTRSVERKCVLFSHDAQEELPANCLIFLNRLSDYFFVLARYVAKADGVKEIPWKPHH